MSILNLFEQKVSSADATAGIVDAKGQKVTLDRAGQADEGASHRDAAIKKNRKIAVVGFRLLGLCSDGHARDMAVTMEMATELMALVRKHKPVLDENPVMVAKVFKKVRGTEVRDGVVVRERVE